MTQYQGENFRMGSVCAAPGNVEVYRHLTRLGFETHSTLTHHRPAMNANPSRGSQRYSGPVKNTVPIQTVKSLIDRRKPIILAHRVGTFSYGSAVDMSGHGYHAVVITGYDEQRSAFFFHNPADDSPQPVTNVATTMSSIANAIVDFERRLNFPALMTLQ